jgi:hypothetical protein
MAAMEKHEAFAADVTREFKFLEEEYGLRRMPQHVGPEGSWIVYAGADVSVTIEQERGVECGVSVRNLRHVKHDPLERGEFDLEELVAVAGAAGGAGGPGRRQPPRSMTEAIARAAETLRTIGAPVLRGDFEALQTRQRKAVDALRRFNPLNPEKESSR